MPSQPSQPWHRARAILGVALGALLAVPATLWGQSQPKLPVPLPTPKTPAAQPAPAPETAAPGPGAAPAPAGPRDPFEPLVKKPEPSEERKAPPLAGVKLVGVIWDPRSPEDIRALVETPDGLGYYLRANEEKFGGTVTAIERDRVRFTVREQIPGVGTRERIVELKLAQPEAQ